MSIANSIRAQIPPIHSEGYPFIGGFALASLILFWIWTPLGWIGTLLTIWCALFFRGRAHLAGDAGAAASRTRPW
jgi:phosphatidylserine decarboxylase